MGMADSDRFLVSCRNAAVPAAISASSFRMRSAMTVAGLAPAGVLFGFGAFLIGTGLFFGFPLPVQRMKAISAVILGFVYNAQYCEPI
jgi:hypothetical protein